MLVLPSSGVAVLLDVHWPGRTLSGAKDIVDGARRSSSVLLRLEGDGCWRMCLLFLPLSKGSALLDVYWPDHVPSGAKHDGYGARRSSSVVLRPVDNGRACDGGLGGHVMVGGVGGVSVKLHKLLNSDSEVCP